MRASASPAGAVEAWLLRTAATVLSGRGPRGALQILMYHRVLTEPDPMLPDEPDAATFEAQVAFLADNFNVLSLTEACERLQSGRLPARALCITFDDGYANNRIVAAPILRARGLPATVYVATGYLDGGRMFNDTVIETVRRAGPRLDLSALGLGVHELSDPAARREAVGAILGAVKYLEPDERLERTRALAEAIGVDLPNDLMMTRDEVRELAGYGIEVGAHTVHHPILTRIAEERARNEIVQSKLELQHITGAPVSHFAYPNGVPGRDYDRTHVELVRQARFASAVSTARGVATSRGDLFQLPRSAPWYGPQRRARMRLVDGYRGRSFHRV